MGLYRSSSHVYWRCKYHIVWTPKYRFRILKDKLGKELYRTIYILCGIKDCEVLELNVQPDHVHLVVIIPPKISISTLMGHLKGRSAIRLYNRFPHIRKKLWGNHFWSRGYFVDTVGVNEEIIRRYVRHQEKTEQTHEQQMELLEQSSKVNSSPPYRGHSQKPPSQKVVFYFLSTSCLTVSAYWATNASMLLVSIPCGLSWYLPLTYIAGTPCSWKSAAAFSC